jgi:16S rRNA (adenine1518-N6/adenine1519-N6)-dimethyltransferase
MAARWRGEPIAVCGNLPYHIAAPLIFRVLEERAHVTRAGVMVQREMADRIIAKPGTKAYGALGVMVRTVADVQVVAKVSPGSFVPPPKVDSSLLRIVPLPAPRAEINDYPLYSKTVHAAFGQRRKTLRNALSAAFEAEQVAAALAATKIDGVRRGETLELAEFAALANALGEKVAQRA